METLIIIAISIIVIIIVIFGIVSMLYIHTELTELNETAQINAYFLFFFLITKIYIRKIKQQGQFYEIYCEVVNFQLT